MRERLFHRSVAAVTAVAALTCATAWAGPQADPTATRGSESAVWVSKQVNFVYREFTTAYSCDGLQDRMKRVLLDLGARGDVQVRGFGCTRLVGPDPLAAVSIRMSVLQPARGQSGPAVPAHWKSVDLLATPDDRDPVDAAADCELIGQIRREILPLFATRNVDYRATCVPHQQVPGSTRLKAEVLVADPGAAPSTS